MSRRLGKILIDMGYLDEDSLWEVLEEQKKSPDLIGRVAVRLGKVKEDQVLKALAEQLGMKVVKLGDLTIPPEVADSMNETMATAYKVVPLSVNKKSGIEPPVGAVIVLAPPVIAPSPLGLHQ